MNNIIPNSKVFLIPFAESFTFPYGNMVLLPTDFMQSIDNFNKEKKLPPPFPPLSYHKFDVKVMFKKKDNRIFEESERLFRNCLESERLIWYFGKSIFLKKMQEVFEKNHNQFDVLFLDHIKLGYSDRVENCLFSTHEMEPGRVAWDLLPLRSPITAELLLCYQ